MATPEQVAADIINLGVSPTDILKLSQPTPRDRIRQLPKAGRMLDYVTARYVMDVLDDVVGPENWQSEHTMQGDKVACRIGIRISGEWVWKSDGAGETDIEGEKGSFSDALKRAAVSWGIARDLYPDAANHQETQADAGRAPSRPAAAAYVPPDPDSGNNRAVGGCPVHGKPWKKGTNGRPDYCSTKVGNGWCQEHPA